MKLSTARTRLGWIAASCGLIAALGAQIPEDVPPATSALPAAVIPDQYLVEVQAGVDPRAVAPTHRVLPKFVYRVAVNGFAASVPPGRLAALKADPRVLRVTPDRRVAAVAKPGTGGGGGTGQIVPEGVKRIGAAPADNLGRGAGIGVAVVDTGVDFNHSDLKPLGAASYSAVSASAQDDNGHGTHVAGTVAARHNAEGVVGVAPEATVYAVKVLDAAGSGSDASVLAGLNWVASMAPYTLPPIRVVNLSLGRAGSLNDNPPLRAAIQSLSAAGITVVVAAGNDASLEVSQQVPSTYPEVLAIASTTAKDGSNQYRFFSGFIAADTASYFTSDGRFNPATGIGVTVSAPGADAENIGKSGSIQSVGILSTRLGGGTTRMSGTSMAAPHAAGVAALLTAQEPALTPEAIRLRLRGGAQRTGTAPLDSPTRGYSFDGEREGVLSAPGALQP